MRMNVALFDTARWVNYHYLPIAKSTTVAIKILGDRVTLAGVNQNGLPSGIFNDTEAGATGKGGDINIKAKSLSLTDGAV